MNKDALAFGISIEPPPSTLPPDAQEYLSRVMIQISGQFANLARDLDVAQKRIKALEDA